MTVDAPAEVPDRAIDEALGKAPDRPPGEPPTTYQVAVAGVVGAAVRQSLPHVRAVGVSVSTVFHLETEPGDGPVEIAALLADRGLDVLSIRRLTGT